jgi:hypothetical protein
MTKNHIAVHKSLVCKIHQLGYLKFQKQARKLQTLVQFY